jgi:hypothetical protein
MSRKFHLIASALAAVAVAAPIAQAKPVDPLAVSLLNGRGFSAGQIFDWTQGACSFSVKPASCYLTPAEAKLASQRLAESMGGPRPIAASIAEAKPVDPLAVSLLRARGMSPSRIYDWTQGACSDEVKPAACYLTPAEARLASQRLAESMGGPRPIPAVSGASARSAHVAQATDDAALMKAYLISHPAMAAAIGSSLARTTGGGATDAGSTLDVAGRGFDWGDALIGAAVTAGTGIFLLGAAGGFRLRRRRELARP